MNARRRNHVKNGQNVRMMPSGENNFSSTSSCELCVHTFLRFFFLFFFAGPFFLFPFAAIGGTHAKLADAIHFLQEVLL